MQFEILRGDCLAVMQLLPDNSFDSIVTDPPYELGFMGKTWDASGIAYNVDMWREALRVLKPGGHLLAFSGSRTYHRMTCAIEDAGFDIRDQIMWVYGSGFPKSLDVSKAIDKAAGAERTKIRVAAAEVRNPKASGGGRDGAEGATRPWIEKAMANGYHEKDSDEPATDAARHWEGWGTALKPAHEPICVARKPLVGTVAANVLQFGTGALNIDGCRVEFAGDADKANAKPQGRATSASGNLAGKAQGGADRAEYEHVQGAGRWPANLIHDGSDEVLAEFPETAPSKASMRGVGLTGADDKVFGKGDPNFNTVRGHSDNGGSAARFFYCAKASKSDRGPGNTHPTVKPLALMRYLLRLVTPPGGRALDPFAGSGSTIVAGLQEGFIMTGIELTPEYADIAEDRAVAELCGGML